MTEKPIYKVVIAGGRDFLDYNLLREKVDKILIDKRVTHKVVIISGCARGADTLALRYASENVLDVEEYPANWDKYGKKAGYLRNAEMAKVSDALIAFWDGKSKGTKHMIDLATENVFDITYLIISYVILFIVIIF